MSGRGGGDLDSARLQELFRKLSDALTGRGQTAQLLPRHQYMSPTPRTALAGRE